MTTGSGSAGCLPTVHQPCPVCGGKMVHPPTLPTNHPTDLENDEALVAKAVKECAQDEPAAQAVGSQFPVTTGCLALRSGPTAHVIECRSLPNRGPLH